MPEPARLLIVSGNTYPDDPWSIHTARLWEELAHSFEEVHIFARSESQHFHSESRGRVAVHLIPRGPQRMATFILTSWLLLAYLLRIKPTHIQAQSPVHGGLVATLSGRLLRAPVFVELHGEQYLRDRPHGSRAHRYLYRPLSKVSFYFAAGIRSLSDEMTEEIAAVYGPRAAAKVVKVANRVDLSVFSPPKKDYAIADCLKVVTVGALVSNKNHLQLISMLADADVKCSLTIIGAGPLAGELQAHAQRVGLPLTIRKGLSHHELAPALRGHDVYVHFSRSEAVSRAVLEAMAMALPVVLTPVGFMRGIIRTGSNGIRLTSEHDLGHTLRQLTSSQHLRQTLGQRARRTIEENHEWASVFNHHAETIRRLR